MKFREFQRKHAEGASGDQVSAIQRQFLRAAYVVFAGCCLYFLFHWFPYRDGAQTRDFVAPYAGARCLWTGCNPYDSQQIAKSFADAGGLSTDHPDWKWEPAVYPPSTLIELLPFSLLRYHAARIVWYGCNALTFCAGMLMMTFFIRRRYRPWALLAGALALTSETVALLFNIGQPTGSAVGLLVIALWFLLKTDRWMAGVICLGLSLGLKPQLAGLVFLCLLWRTRHRAAAVRAGGLAGAFLVCGLAWLTLSPDAKGWRQDYHAQVEGSLVPGGINDPTVKNYGSEQFTNLQTVFALIHETPAFYNSMTYGAAAILLTAWVVGSLRQREDAAGLWVSIAAMACIGLLPVYHREYDCVLLILTWPILGWMAARRQWLVVPAAACTAWLLMTAPRFHRHWFGHLRNAPGSPAFPKLRIAIYQYPQPLLLLTLSVIYLVVMFDVAREPERADDALVQTIG